MMYLTFYGSAGGCIHVEGNAESDKIRCYVMPAVYFLHENVILRHAMHAYLLQNEQYTPVIDFINLFLSYRCMLNILCKVLTEVYVDIRGIIRIIQLQTLS